MLAEVLSALMINRSNVSLDEYRTVLENQPKSKIEQNKNYDFFLTSQEKEHLNSISQELIETMSLFRDYNEEVFKSNFERWEIKEASNLLSLVKDIIDEHSEISSLWEKEAKYYKKYPSIADKNRQISQIHKEIVDFTREYLKRAKEADEASKFMDRFVVDNQEVLDALA